jgi:hypothetical protein
MSGPIMRYTSPRWPIRVAAALALVIVLLIDPTCEADGADWYPAECRADSYCGDIVGVTYAPGPATVHTLLTVTTKHGTALVPHPLVVRPSADQAMHACMRVEQEGLELACLFLPPPVDDTLRPTH